ncbi:unnamed protein product [Oppiella nova]|uniref:Uncharacterized protein n=1 Tax=Oppiella nova TaxID=334625 RepID=A0A7R9QMR8_9ACAR|nr:unnamed protein product [Oppiella nova]CAG2168397.1 unnamed protein product [Oppiella nova]
MYRDKQTMDFNEYVTVIINQCIIFGATNIKRVSNDTQFKSLGDKRFTIGCDLLMTDLRVNVNFDAKLGFPKYRLHPQLKTCCVSINSFVFNIEFILNIKQQSIRVNRVSLVNKDRIRCVSTGFIWPINKTVETLIRKNVELFITDNQSELEFRAKQAINELFSPTFAELFDDNSLVVDKNFKSIIQRLKC